MVMRFFVVILFNLNHNKVTACTPNTSHQPIAVYCWTKAQVHIAAETMDHADRAEFLKYQVQQQIKAELANKKKLWRLPEDEKATPVANAQYDYVDLSQVPITPVDEKDERKKDERFRLPQLKTTTTTTTTEKPFYIYKSKKARPAERRPEPTEAPDDDSPSPPPNPLSDVGEDDNPFPKRSPIKTPNKQRPILQKPGYIKNNNQPSKKLGNSKHYQGLEGLKTLKNADSKDRLKKAMFEESNEGAELKNDNGNDERHLKDDEDNEDHTLRNENDHVGRTLNIDNDNDDRNSRDGIDSDGNNNDDSNGKKNNKKDGISVENHNFEKTSNKGSSKTDASKYEYNKLSAKRKKKAKDTQKGDIKSSNHKDIFYRRGTKHHARAVLRSQAMKISPLNDENRNVPIKWIHCEDLISPFLTGINIEMFEPKFISLEHRTALRLRHLFTLNTTTYSKEDIFSLLYQISNIQIRLFQWEIPALKMFINVLTQGKPNSFKNLKWGVQALFNKWHMDLRNKTSLLSQARIFRPYCINLLELDGSTQSSKASKYYPSTTPKQDKDCRRNKNDTIIKTPENKSNTSSINSTIHINRNANSSVSINSSISTNESLSFRNSATPTNNPIAIEEKLKITTPTVNSSTINVNSSTSRNNSSTSRNNSSKSANNSSTSAKNSATIAKKLSTYSPIINSTTTINLQTRQNVVNSTNKSI